MALGLGVHSDVQVGRVAVLGGLGPRVAEEAEEVAEVGKGRAEPPEEEAGKGPKQALGEGEGEGPVGAGPEDVAHHPAFLLGHQVAAAGLQVGGHEEGSPEGFAGEDLWAFPAEEEGLVGEAGDGREVFGVRLPHLGHAPSL